MGGVRRGGARLAPTKAALVHCQMVLAFCLAAQRKPEPPVALNMSFWLQKTLKMVVLGAHVP